MGAADSPTVPPPVSVRQVDKWLHFFKVSQTNLSGNQPLLLGGSSRFWSTAHETWETADRIRFKRINSPQTAAVCMRTVRILFQIRLWKKIPWHLECQWDKTGSGENVESLHLETLQVMSYFVKTRSQNVVSVKMIKEAVSLEKFSNLKPQPSPKKLVSTSIITVLLLNIQKISINNGFRFTNLRITCMELNSNTFWVHQVCNRADLLFLDFVKLKKLSGSFSSSFAAASATPLLAYILSEINNTYMQSDKWKKNSSQDISTTVFLASFYFHTLFTPLEFVQPSQKWREKVFSNHLGVPSISSTWFLPASRVFIFLLGSFFLLLSVTFIPRLWSDGGIGTSSS